MIYYNIPEKILALASVMQPLGLIHDLANKGECDAKSLDASLLSITKNGNSVREVYNIEEDLVVGLKTLKKVLTKSNANRNLLLYFLGVLKIEKSLRKSSNASDIVSHTIESLKNLPDSEFTTHHSVAKLAELYRKIAQILDQRIIINGKKHNLINQEVANHIRALLLAGVRSVSLWRTLGGNIWYLILNKKRIISYLNNTIK